MCGKYQDVGSKPSHQLQASDNGSDQAVINLDHGDPTMYESYWKEIGQKHGVTFPVFQSISYFSNPRNMCWFLEPKLEEEIRRLHKTVGNAVTENRYIVVGTGSSQLIMAAWYALSEPLNHPDPVNVVSASPYYSSYPEMANFMRSRLFKWSGDARKFSEEGPYIEMVTSPNNPDGVTREAVVNREGGMTVHDLAYYWPQYTAITSPADHDIMLFTFSKCTGHAGSRIGWAVVRDEKVARKMVKYIEVNTIGVSKEAQFRAAKIIEIVSLSCLKSHRPNEIENFFEHSRRLLAERWKGLRDVIKKNGVFHVAKFAMKHCNFFKESTETYPAFAWIKCKEGGDCVAEQVLRDRMILTRGGRRFGSDVEYVRVSMLSRDDEFDLFLERLSNIRGTRSEN